jgi:hypothetical protein
MSPIHEACLLYMSHVSYIHGIYVGVSRSIQQREAYVIARMCVYVCACVRVCVCACVRVCVYIWDGVHTGTVESGVQRLLPAV